MLNLSFGCLCPFFFFLPCALVEATEFYSDSSNFDFQEEEIPGS